MHIFTEAEDVESVPALVARVIDRHHAFLRRSLPEVSLLVAKIAEVHGPRVPELGALRDAFGSLRELLERGMAAEETRHFPRLMAAGGPAESAAERGALEATRASVEASLDRIRELTGEYRVPEGACRTWIRALVELEDLEIDLRRHLALEERLRLRASSSAA